MSVHYYINKDGDRKIGKPEHVEMYAKIGYAPENKDSDNDGLQDGDPEKEALRDELTALNVPFKGSNGVATLKKLLKEAQAE